MGEGKGRVVGRSGSGGGGIEEGERRGRLKLGSMRVRWAVLGFVSLLFRHLLN